MIMEALLPVKVGYDPGDLLRPRHVPLPDLDPGGGGLWLPLTSVQLWQRGADLQELGLKWGVQS